MASPEDNDPKGHSAAEPAEDRIQSPHDRLINQTLQQLDAARTLLANHLPHEVVRDLKLSTLARVDTSFIDRNLKRRFADRLFSIEVSDEVVKSLGLRTNFIYVLVLIDHKSTDEPWALIQMLGYIVRIWENQLDNAQPLVPIIPWVIYNGVRPWQTARSLEELIRVPANWKRYVPGLELPILDISRMDDATMVGEPVLQVAFTLLKYGRSSQLDAVLRPLFQMLSQAISQHQAKDLLDTIKVYVMSVNRVVGEEKLNELVSEFWPVQPEAGSIADQLIKKGEVQGEARGVAQERISMIRALQAILGVPQSSDEELATTSHDELQTMIASLQQQIAQRIG
ncbi:MAG: Rpn family recombination-promoting nuclease/putative transposase [Pirellulaceae bacterium]